MPTNHELLLRHMNGLHLRCTELFNECQAAYDEAIETVGAGRALKERAREAARAKSREHTATSNAFRVASFYEMRAYGANLDGKRWQI